MADTTRKFLWKAQPPDFRDYQFKGSTWARRMLVRWGWYGSADLRSGMPPVFEQGSLGSCTAQAITAAVIFASKCQTLLSRLFLYFNERAAIGTTSYDSGAIIRDGLKSVVKQGSVPETSWPYAVEALTTQPPSSLYAVALKDLVVRYATVPQNLVSLRCAILEGYPVVFGISAFSSFFSDPGGNIPLPQPGEQLLGGHAILLVGFDNATKRFIFRNSWGEGWGQAGYGTIPYDYVTNPGLASDFWVVERTTE